MNTRHWLAACFVAPVLTAAGLLPTLRFGGDPETKLNPALALDVVGTVQENRVWISPDETRVVYVADQRMEDVFELFAAPLDGSTPPVRLNETWGGPEDPTTRQVWYAAFSPDSSEVLYSVIGPSFAELWVAPADGAAPPRLLVGPALPGRLRDAVFAPDGQSLLYQHDDQLFSVATDGTSSPVALHAAALDDFEEFVVTPDGSTIVYRAAQDDASMVELYALPIGGGTPRKLNAPLPTGRDVSDFALSPDGLRLAYLANPTFWNSSELLSVPVDGSTAATPISGPLLADADVAGNFRFTPDSSHLVYQADATTLDVVNLYAAPADGSAPPTQLNPTPVSGGDVRDFDLDPSSSLVAYTGDLSVDGISNAYVVPLQGGASTVLSSPSHGEATLVRIDPQGGQLFYTARVTSRSYELYTVPLNGSGPAVLLSPSTGVERNTFLPTFNADGTRALYRSLLYGDYAYELYSAPVDGSVPETLLSPPVPVASYGVDRFLPFGDAALLVTDPNGTWHYELVRVSDDGSVPAFSVSGPPLGGVVGDVEDRILFSPGGETTLFFADATTDEVQELYLAPADGSVAARRLDELAGIAPGAIQVRDLDRTWGDGNVVFLGEDADQYRLFRLALEENAPPLRLDALPTDQAFDVVYYNVTPDGETVVYIADQEQDGVDQLYSVPIDGGVPILLSGDVFPDNDVLRWNGWGDALLFTPDSQRVLFLGDLNFGGRDDLYSVPVDGSSERVKLTGTVPEYSTVTSFLLDPSGQNVLFRADRDGPSDFELWIAPVDGSGPIRKLTPGPDGRVAFGRTDAQLTSDGTRVVFTYSLANGPDELYVVPLDGSQPPLRLNDPLPDGRDVFDFLLTEDDLVVFRADVVFEDRIGLYVVPADGSAAQVKLQGNLVNGGDVSADYAVTPDGQWVVYRADETVDDRNDLYIVPIDRSVAPVPLVDAFAPGGEVIERSLQLTSDGTRAFFLADLQVNERVELFSVPLDGSSLPRKRNGELQPLGDVESFAIAPDLRHVLYRADQETEGAVELYSVPLGPRVLAVAPSDGSFDGGTTVVLTGSSFSPETEVFFGGKRATSVTYIGPEELHVVTPPSRPIPPAIMGPPRGKFRAANYGRRSVDVLVRGEGARDVLADGFRYVPIVP